MGAGKLSGKPGEIQASYFVMDWHPLHRGVVIILVALYYLETGISPS